MMMRQVIRNNFYIITGGPGVGKTTLIEELCRQGYTCIPEVAREIIKQQVHNGGTALPWMDTKEYSKLMLNYSIRDFISLRENNQLYFFDRGIPDTYGYELLMNFGKNTELENAVYKYRYNNTVFILPPWKEIYETDSERKQDFETAVETYHVMKKAYRQAGYSLMEVPCLPPTKRAEFILHFPF